MANQYSSNNNSLLSSSHVRNSSTKSQRGVCLENRFISSNNGSQERNKQFLETPKSIMIKDNKMNADLQSVNSNQYQSRFGSNQKVPGVIYRGNSAYKSQNVSMIQSRVDLTDSAQNHEINAQDSPIVMVTKELKFETEESQNENEEEVADLNTLLQLNEDTQNYTDNNQRLFENSSLLNRHSIVKERYHEHGIQKYIHNRSIVEGLNNLKEPIIINNEKIYEPFYDHCWK